MAIDQDSDFHLIEPWSKETILSLLDICLESTFFGFREKVYHQRKGTPMGSPISVVISEIVLQRFETDNFLSTINLCRLWLRYVDDTFTFVKTAQLEEFHQIINEKGDFHQGN